MQYLLSADVWFAILAIVFLAALFGILLGFASIKFKVEADPIAEQIEAILPQTQCGQCGYPGCRPYAQAIANGDAINKCPPGGQAVIDKLSELMGVEATSLAHDEEKSIKKIAFIREEDCIGCTKCIQACPVDAIVGSTRSIHTVISDICTGCDLCVSPCPTDCIDMLPISMTPDNWRWQLELIPVRNIHSNDQSVK